MSLDVFIGPARIVDARAGGPLLMPEDIKSQLQDAPPRVLLRLHENTDPNIWNPNFRALSQDVVSLLNDHGVKLIGVDTPSVDPETLKRIASPHDCKQVRYEDLRKSNVEPCNARRL